MVDVEADLRAKIASGAKTFVVLIGRMQTTSDGAMDGLIRDAFGSVERLRDAAELLERDDPDATAALALLRRAIRRAEDPPPPEGPRPPEPRPDAGRFSRTDAPEDGAG